MKKTSKKRSKAGQTHCVLDHLLSAEEVELVRTLFGQQGIRLKESQLVARIKKAGPRKNCPSRFHLAPGVDFCASGCYLKAFKKRLK